MREVRGLDHGSDGGASSDLVGLPDVMVQAGSHLATYVNSESGRLRIAIPFLSSTAHRCSRQSRHTRTSLTLAS